MPPADRDGHRAAVARIQPLVTARDACLMAASKATHHAIVPIQRPMAKPTAAPKAAPSNAPSDAAGHLGRRVDDAGAQAAPGVGEDAQTDARAEPERDADVPDSQRQQDGRGIVPALAEELLADLRREQAEHHAPDRA